jgi:hypothetical protein
LIAPTEEDVGEYTELSVDGNGEEAEPVKHAADPGAPTASQVEEHRKTHIPFRSWCKWCVLGRGRGIQHRKAGASDIPIIGVDYFFLTKGVPSLGGSLSTPSLMRARLSSRQHVPTATS